MLRWRMPLGILLSATLVVLCWLDLDSALPGIWLAPVAAAAAVLATYEVLALAAATGLRPRAWPVYCGNLLIVCGTWLTYAALTASRSLGGSADPLWAFDRSLATAMPLGWLALAVLVVFCVETCRYEKPGGNLANVAGAVFALVYVGMMLGLAASLRTTWGIGALASWIVVVKLGDTGAYFIGRLIGRHKLAPSISPGKTVEGALGDLAFCLLGAWLVFGWLVPLTVPESVAVGPWWGWIVFGVLVGAAGMIGDLAESVLKRDAGRKDSSDWLPGLGGALDILDSLLLSAPVAWFCWAVGIVGR